MGVYTKLICDGCGKVAAPGKAPSKTTYCQCGGVMRHTKKWGVRLDINGERFNEFGFESRGDADAVDAKMRADIRSGVIAKKPSALTVREAYEQIVVPELERRVKRNLLAAKSSTRYQCSFSTAILSLMGDVKITQIDRLMVNQFMELREGQVSRLGKAPTPCTINKDVVAIKVMISILIEKGYLSVNKLSGFRRLPENNERSRYLLPAEVDALIAACKTPHSRLAVMIAVNTGLRIEGCLTLRWDEIDFKGMGVINKLVKGPAKKGRKLVTIPLTKPLRAELLKAWQSRKVISDYVIPSPRFKVDPLNPRKPAPHMDLTANFGFETACKSVGIMDFTFHDLRHTFATNFLEQYPDQIEVLATIMGHDGATMTRRYAHIINKAKERLMVNFSLGASNG